MRKLTLLAIYAALALNISAQTPLITLHTDCYAQYGEGSIITLALGATANGTVEVTAGGVSRQWQIVPAQYNAETQSVDATYVYCEPDASGVVEISALTDIDIDYFNGDGCAITDIAFHHPQTIDVLSLRHNNLSAIDLTQMTQASSIDLGDNPFNVSPAIIGAPKERLAILSLDMVGALDPAFSLTDYPSLVVFEAYGTTSLTACDPTQCPALAKLTIDGTSVVSLDVSQNPSLLILNVSESGVSSLDLSNNQRLRELYCDHRSSSINTDADFTTLDLTHCPDLVYLFCSGNKLTQLDLSQNVNLQDLYCRDNLLTSLDLSHNPALRNVMITDNYMDFNTLPVDPGTWMEYDCRQRPLQVPTSYLLGTDIDMSGAVVRTDSPTYAALMAVSADDPSDVREVDPSYYTYDAGVIAITREIPDSVYVTYYNPTFPDITLQTTCFKVKNSDAYGQDDLAFTLNIPMVSTTDRVKMSIGMNGASEDEPKTFYIDMGDGQKRSFTATSADLPDAPNVNVVKGANGLVTVYVPEGEKVTAIGIADIYVADIDLSNLEGLSQLSLTNTGMYAIDLSRNRMLQSLTLTGNHFGSSLSLAGINGAFEKYKLTDINLSNNEMSAVQINTIELVEHLDLSLNSLTTIDFTDAESITTLNVSDNDFETLKINYLSSLRHLDAHANQLTQIIMPETNVIEWMDIRDNRFTLANMPNRGSVTESNYLYAPQAPIPVAAKGPGCDLSSQCISIDGHATAFAWVDADGATLTKGIDYDIAEGKTTFLAPCFGKALHCVINNEAYPAFSGANALRTTEITAMEAPQHVAGSFTTLDSRTANLSLASAVPANSIYIDWGDGILAEYQLDTTYRLFTADTHANAQVKVYSYDADNNISVFSMSAGPLADVDLSAMRQLACLSLTDAQIAGLEMPQSSTLTELFLDGNEFSDFDFHAWPSLQFVSFARNRFESADLTGLSNLQNISFANNSLRSIALGSNDNLWGIYLNNNRLTDIDLSGAPVAYQVTLNYNDLSHIDVDALADLRVLYIDHNRFDFTTLPLPRPQWTLYVYGDQQPLAVTPVDGVVDLSSQACVGDSPTEYTWIMGEPWLDPETGQYMADVLIEGTDYVITDGVTRFLQDNYDVSCLLYNPAFPAMVLTTTTFDVVPSGLKQPASLSNLATHIIGHDIQIITSPDTLIYAYSTSGQLVGSGKSDAQGRLTFRNMPAGVIIIKSQNLASKVIIE